MKTIAIALVILFVLTLGIIIGGKVTEAIYRHDLECITRDNAMHIESLACEIAALNDRLIYMTEAMTIRGLASYYGRPFHGRKTANGETFDKNDLTAASCWLPFGSVWQIKNIENGLSVIVRINDRGPYVGERMLDLSEAAAHKLGMIKHGVVKVTMVPKMGEERIS